MKIKKVHFQNFRSIKDQTIFFEDQTIFIGGNGVGKSTILKGIAAFFDIGFRPKSEDYFAHKPDIGMSLTVTFSGFSPKEEKDFSSRIHDGEMIVSRDFGGPSENSGDYQGYLIGNSAFQQIRMATNAKDKRVLYEAAIANGYDLPKWKTIADADQALTTWESANKEKCGLVKDGGNFFGFKSVGGGKLQQATNFILIEAVRDVSNDANDAKNSAIGQLMDLIVRSALKQSKAITDYQQEINKKLSEITNPSNFPQLGTLGDTLSRSLGKYYSNTGVNLDWRAMGGITLPLPQAEINFVENNFKFPVAKAGNGVQRAFIIALLHQLLIAKQTYLSVDNEESSIEPTNEQLPSVILAIEEPELYQHPTKQWHFAQTLKQLSSGQHGNVFGDVQVMFCTHSPSFVSISEFHDTRIGLKEICAETGVGHSIFKSSTFEDLTSMLEKISGGVAGSFSTEQTKARLHIFGTHLSEGFFASGVILVEGVSDKAALEKTAENLGLNLIRDNIAVLCVGGKNNLHKPYVIFRSLGIPTYVVWDSDADCKADATINVIESNKLLQRMVGLDELFWNDFPSETSEHFACFEKNLNRALEEELGGYFVSLITEQSHLFGLSKKDGDKNPYVMSVVIDKLYQDNRPPAALQTIIYAARSFILDDPLCFAKAA